MKSTIRNRQYLLIDIVLLALAAYLSYVLRLDGTNLNRHWPNFAIFTVTALVITPVIFRWTGVYSRYWRYASIDELRLLTVAMTASVIATSCISISVAKLGALQQPIPRSVPFIFLLLALAATAGPRLAVRLTANPHREKPEKTPLLNVIVMGAGDAGSMIVRELQKNTHLGMTVIGLLDDDRTKYGKYIYGVPVLGSRQMISQLATERSIGQVIIAMPTAPGKTIREIVEICEQAGVQARTIPGVFELLGGTVSVNQLRNVQIEDLLRREPVSSDSDALSELIRGKRVLITGGGGSIGSELCRQILRHGPSDLVVLGHGENSIFEIYGELRRQKYREGEQSSDIAFAFVHTVIADIRFADRVRAVFEEYRPEIVFHTAAHKHVPLMEANPGEAITNNIVGTRNLLNAALAVGVEQFVMISSDKAVNPTSIMGVTKRAAELLVHQAARISGKRYVAVRFGNVLGSRGSVIHTFRQQIAEGGPITITHPEMKRYFMTIPEAVQLVLQAAVLGKGSEVFLLDMGEPVKIVDLARDLIELSGLEVGRDIDIIHTGLRPGEKLFEELFTPGESYQRTRHEKIFVASSVNNGAEWVAMEHYWSCLDEAVDVLAEAACRNDRSELAPMLKLLVPEFQPSEIEFSLQPFPVGQVLQTTGNKVSYASAD